MQVVKDIKNGLLLHAFGIGENYHLTLTVLLFFDLADPAKLLTEQEMWQSVTRALGRDAMLDQGMPKPRGEFLVAGSCFSPPGNPRRASFVRCRVGAREKNLHVFGNRRWVRAGKAVWAISDPEPFTEIPINWENAFGGKGYEKNPLGKGMVPIALPDGKKAVPLPQVEDPRKLIGSPSNRPDPAGFLPYGIDRPQRTGKLGTYDAKWLRERWPYYPEDMDYTFFNAAPPDQQLEGFFRGDEEIEILNMHPTEPHVRSRLPGVRARSFVTAVGNRKTGEEEFRDVPMRLDTVWLFPSLLRGIVLFRGTTPVRDDEYEDVRRVFVATEKLEEAPKDIAFYLEEEKRKMAFDVPADMPSVEASMEEARKEMDKAMKQVAVIPRRMEEAKNRAMGKAPPLPPDLNDAASRSRVLAENASARLEEMEKRLKELKSEYGHLVKIDTAPLVRAREGLAAVPARIAAASAAAEEAARQTDGIKEGMIRSVKEELSPESMAKRGFPLDVLKEKGVLDAALFSEEKKDPWQVRGMAFLKECVACLEKNQERRNDIQTQGFSEDIVRQAWLGYNESERCEDPAAWGLPASRDGQGKEERMVIPAGFVIPCFRGVAIDRITVRPGSIRDFFRDMIVPGSGETPCEAGFGERKSVVVVRDEMEVWLLYQKAWDICTVVAVRGPDLKQLKDNALKKRMEASPCVLIASPAIDEPVDRPDLRDWIKAFPQAKEAPLPGGRSLLDACEKGWDIRRWLLDSLPATAVPEKVAREEEKKKSGWWFPEIDIKGMAAVFRKDVEAAIAPMLREAEVMKQQMMAEVRDVLRKRGIDPATVFTSAASAPVTADTFRTLDMSSDLREAKERLLKMGQLTPELEGEIDRMGAGMKELLEDAARRQEEGMAKVAKAQAFAKDPLPEWAKERMKKAGIDPEKGMVKLTREEVRERRARGEGMEGADLSGLDLSNLDLSGIVLKGARLGKACFSGSNLDGADLSGALCEEADFSTTSLRSARLDEGIFSKAIFKESELSGADLKKALLSEADFSGAILVEACLEGALLDKTVLSGTRCRGASLKSATVNNAEAEKADFTSADLSRVVFVETRLSDSNLKGAKVNSAVFWKVEAARSLFSQGDLSGIHISGSSDFRNADFSGAVMEKANVMNSDLSECDFRECRLDGAILEGCNLSGSHLYRVSARETKFNKSDMEKADMRGINLFGGSLRKARLVNADLRGSNLYSVEFYRATLGKTLMDGSNLKKTILDGRKDLLK